MQKDQGSLRVVFFYFEREGVQVERGW